MSFDHWPEDAPTLCVVDYNVSRGIVTIDDILPEIFFDYCRAYVGERLHFDPLC
jgi:hypothetical protein